MTRALLTPRWLFSHVLMAIAVVVMVFLGLWQLDRLAQKQARNDEVTERTAQPDVPITDLVKVDDPYGIGETVRFRVAQARGVFQPEAEVLVRNRSLDGSPGFWVLTPLRLDDGTGLVINRGWIPFAMGSDQSRTESEAPSGTVVVRGLVRQTVTATGLEKDDAAAGILDSLARVDLERYADQLDHKILPVYLQLETQVPPQVGGLPFPVGRPELSEGSHLSYAVQWFSFAAIAAVGYPLVLRRLSQRDGRPGRKSDIPIDYL